MDFWKWMEYGVDFGLPVVLACLGWGLVWFGYRTYRKVAARRCVHCGYDMRETAGLICPECGKSAKTQRIVEHGYVRRWAVVLGWVMFVPVVWVVVWLGVSFFVQLWPGEGAEVIAEVKEPAPPEMAEIRRMVEEQESGAPVRLSSELTYVSQATYETMPERVVPNAVAGWTFTKIRQWWAQMSLWGQPVNVTAFAGVGAGSPDPEWSTVQGRMIYGYEVYVDYSGVKLSLSPPRPVTILCCEPEDPMGLKWTVYLAHTVVCPINHYGRYTGPMRVKMVEAMRAPIAQVTKYEPPFWTVTLTRHGSTAARVPAKLVRALHGLKGVNALKLNGIEIDDPLIEAVAAMPVLERLTLVESEISDAQVERLARNGGIKRLTLELDREITVGMLVGLGKWPGLEEVTFANAIGMVRMTDAEFASFVGGKSLKSVGGFGVISLRGTAHTGAVMERKPVKFDKGMVFGVKQKDMTKQMKKLAADGVMHLEVEE